MANNWTRDETIQAFNLYCKTPFSRIDMRNPTIIELAKRLGRTPAAVSYKLANLARLDPALKKRNISGASHGSKMDIEVWNEFHQDWDKLAYESEELISAPKKQLYGEDIVFPIGATRETIIYARVNQQFFRAAVLTAYDYKCCITGLPIPELLIASHIVPWKDDAKNRTNPRNGLCLNTLHDKAFDLGFVTITPKLTILLSPQLKKWELSVSVQEFFIKYKGASLIAPSRFAPDAEFLKFHNEVVFQSK